MKSGLNISQRLNRDYGKKIERLGKDIWGDLKRLELMNIDLNKYSSKMASAIDDAKKTIVQGSPEPKNDEFSMWRGRGNLHCSFIKKRVKPIKYKNIMN